MAFEKIITYIRSSIKRMLRSANRGEFLIP